MSYGSASRVRVAVIGDVGKPELYHLGDEAMTEAAIDQLRQRGITDITIIAADAVVASQRYGLPATDRVGFNFRDSESAMKERLNRITTDLAHDAILSGDDAVARLARVVSSMDAILIAGGGNLNSQYSYHIYERVALTRLAAHFGKPLFITSQTIGPRVDRRHHNLLAEILRYARALSVRDSSSLATLDALDLVSSDVQRGVDDALLLSDDRVGVPGELSKRYCVATISPYTPMPGVGKEDYKAAVSSILDSVAVALDCDILLLPHAGSLGGTPPVHDQNMHSELATRSTSARFVELPTTSVSDSLLLMRGALASISTRYHPVVLGPAVDIPAIGIGTNRYSSTRMRGAMENLGLSRLFVPWPIATDEYVTRLVKELVDSAAYRSHSNAVVAQRRAESTLWWDSIAECITGTGRTPRQPFADVTEFEVRASWPDLAIVAERYEATDTVFQRLQGEKASLEKRVKYLKTSENALENDLAALKRRRSLVMADTFSAFRSRVARRARHALRRIGRTD